jgi:hypothetical protein
VRITFGEWARNYVRPGPEPNGFDRTTVTVTEGADARSILECVSLIAALVTACRLRMALNGWYIDFCYAGETRSAAAGVGLVRMHHGEL